LPVKTLTVYFIYHYRLDVLVIIIIRCCFIS